MSVPFKGFIAGASGAIVLTALHEVVHRTRPGAPRLDVLGMRAIARVMGRTQDEASDQLHKLALGGDLAANSMYYGMVGTFGSGAALATGAFLGVAAGLGAATLPKPLGLGGDAVNHSRKAEVITVGMYVAGGLVAGAVYRALSD